MLLDAPESVETLSCPAMENYRRVAPRELTPIELRHRKRNLGLARNTSWLFGHGILFNRLLSRGLRSLAKQRRGFAVPSAWGVAACGQGLQLYCPPGQVDLQLTDWVGWGEKRWHLNDFFLGAGDWAPLLKPSTDTFVAREAEELYACAFDFRATRTYAVLMQAAFDGRPVRRQQLLLDRPESVDRYFEHFVRLFHSIQGKGILSCAELSAGGHGTPLERDIGVAIGAGGEVYRLPGGQHRTAIARVLGLKRLPVEVRLVHEQWLRKAIDESSEKPLLALCLGIKQLAATLN
jgi:hypothetical protein